MGMVYEYDGLEESLSSAVSVVPGLDIMSEKINKSADLTLTVRSHTFDVVLGKKLVFSCRCLDNALVLYELIRADVKGETYGG